MNHSLSETNCASSVHTDPGDNTVTSSELYEPMTSDTHDMGNGPVTSQPAHVQALDNIGLIAAVAAVVIVLLGITIIVSVVIVLLVKKRYCSTGACRK